MEIENEKEILPEQNEKQQKKQLARQKRKLKEKEKEELITKMFGLKNMMVKDLSYEKRIFLLTDLIIDLDMFSDSLSNGRPDKFELITCWRPPVKVTLDRSIVHIDLDTSVDGLQTFDQVCSILRSIPNRDAYELSQQIELYNKSIIHYQEKSKDLLYIYNLISQDQKTKYSLNDYFNDQLQQRLKEANEYIYKKYKTNKYISYMIKTRQRNNQVVTKYGYSTELLNVLGFDRDNMYRLLYQNGPLLFYTNQDKINRLKNSLQRRTENLANFCTHIEDLVYKDQTIITFDDLKFTCDIHMTKTQLNEDPNYYVRNVLLIQLAVYDINDSVISELSNLRSQTNELSNTNSQLGIYDIYYGLDYQSQSEMFVSKFYNSEKQKEKVNVEEMDDLIETPPKYLNNQNNY